MKMLATGKQSSRTLRVITIR